ncbi:cytochrome c biogenesis CcdA family protein [Salinibacterium sp. M195]|uniref:cytochrome c biogenesis CcdA family protein n=1 Tax=Salinibacterium sp. M195 TaxID=2583374 RepID=UPI001C6305BE|nr:cytochrome c biogenesis CcdA family protein [Salinibacterium sp. M195]QYH36377.1 cytochrome c biogenesis protein CcdA [Salinibacterium sp. M195]
MEIGLLTAFLGGMLALLSPCSALLLPAFFASTVGTKMQLLVHGAVFYLGLALTLVPFGLGLGALGSLLVSERGLIIAVTAVVLVILGLAQIFGFGFDLSRMLPGATKLQESASARTGLFRTLLLGAVGGVAGFCAGPILGAILTLAFGQSNLWNAGALLAVYGLGMVVPLVIIAALWQKMSARGRRALRGRTFTVLGREFHSTSVITGTLIVAVGALFWFTNGLVSLPSLIPTDVQVWMQERGTVLANPIVDMVAIIVLAAIALTVWGVRRRRNESATPQESAFEQSQ